MRTETLWQSQHRAARMHWWRELLAGPSNSPWEEVLDEMVKLRFRLRDDMPVLTNGEPGIGILSQR